MTGICIAGVAMGLRLEPVLYSFNSLILKPVQPALLINSKAVSLNGDSFTAKRAVLDFQAFLQDGELSAESIPSSHTDNCYLR